MWLDWYSMKFPKELSQDMLDLVDEIHEEDIS